MFKSYNGKLIMMMDKEYAGKPCAVDDGCQYFEEIVMKERVFEAVGEEKIAFRFVTSKEGEILEVNELPANLRNALE